MKVLLVTGASKGIGRATAILGARAGYRVCVNYNSSKEAAINAVDQIRAEGGDAISIKADVSTEAGVKILFEKIDQQLGRLDGLFNNAGVILQTERVENITSKQLEYLWRVNVTSQFLCAREAIKRMSTKNGGYGGSIVNMSSVHSRIGAPGEFVSYAASKGAIDAFTHGLSLEVVNEGIRVNAVRPGLIDTDIHALGGNRNRPNEVSNKIPIGRAGTPEDIAEGVIWLMSDAASYCVNTLLDISGGRS